MLPCQSGLTRSWVLWFAVSGPHAAAFEVEDGRPQVAPWALGLLRECGRKLPMECSGVPALELVLSVYLFAAAGLYLFCKPQLGSCGLRGLYESLQMGGLVEISEIL